MGRKIIDEFTDLPISRQRKWVLRHPDRAKECQRKSYASTQFKHIREPIANPAPVSSVEYLKIKEALKHGKTKPEAARAAKRSFQTIMVIQRSKNFKDYKKIVCEKHLKYKSQETRGTTYGLSY